MPAAPPAHDSVLDALGYAVRVVARPGFLWAPVLLYLILMLPLLPLYVMPGLGATRLGARSWGGLRGSNP